MSSTNYIALRSIVWKGLIKVHIRRGDEVYDLSTENFVAEELASNPYIDLDRGNGMLDSIPNKKFFISPEFTDGLYEVFYHDWASLDRAVFQVDQVVIKNGEVVNFPETICTETAIKLSRNMPRMPLVS